jgi:feruloyl esterase
MRLRLFALCILLAICFRSRAHAAVMDCDALAALPLSQAEIHSELITAKAFTPPSGKTISNLPSVCRVHMLLTPTSDSHIQVEVWLPVQDWNGKLQGIGNGGFAGSISYEGLANALRQNYAAVATDTGHQAGGEDAAWALNHPEKIVDFGYRAIHLMTADARQVIKAFYGTPVKRAYFNSCSDGGREALMEAQRFPDDYDGIIAGAPANYWTHLITNAVVNLKALMTTDSSFIPPSKLPAIQAAVQQACDLNDGVKDGVIENPSRCHFDTSVLLCKGSDSDSCLTADQITALNQLYGGGHLSNGNLFFPGYPPGGEALKDNWDVWITGSAPGKSSMYAYGTQFFKNMVYNNPDWDFHSFQTDRDLKAADDKLADALNSTNPDLNRFVRRGDKLILYHGWDDAAIAAPNTINYYESVRKKIGSAKTDKSIRLFMVPGMQHCFNGNGASSFGQFGAGGGDPTHDVDAALVQWVEKGIAPDQIIATKPGTSMTHPLCKYPATAHYAGTGDPASASSYTCTVDATDSK